jgi:hypothetical protein
MKFSISDVERSDVIVAASTVFGMMLIAVVMGLLFK